MEDQKSNERLKEVILDLERSKVRESSLREQTDVLLQALGALISSTDADTIFNNLLDTLKTVLEFENGFILFSNEEQKEDQYKCIYSTNKEFLNSVWNENDFFKRVKQGKPLATFNINSIEEWNSQPDELKKNVTSALHMPLLGESTKAMLICTHSDKGYFSKKFQSLANKLIPVATQGLIMLEKNQSLQKEIEERKKVENELKALQAELVQKAYVEGVAVNAIDVLHSIGNTLTPLRIITGQLQGDTTLNTVSRFLEQFKEKLSDYKRTGQSQDFFTDIVPLDKFLATLDVVTERTDSFVNDYRGKLSKMEGYVEKIKATVQDQRKFVDLKGQSQESYFIKQIVSDVYEAVIPQFADDNLNLVYVPFKGDNKIQIERNNFHHCLVNLITNSLDSIRERQMDDLSFQGEVEFVTVIRNNRLEISVRDNGVGVENIPEKSLFRLGFTTKENGTGFGLHSVANFINHYKGKVTLESDGKNTGAVATIIIPLDKEE